MKVLIVEDETAAAQNLTAILKEIAPDVEILDVIDTVVDSVEWFRANPTPDLVFMDIHLSDGKSFRIFDSVKVDAPIIFTTAYDQYALEAFKVNGIDYILKPINEQEVLRAIEKWRMLTNADQKAYVERVDAMAQKAVAEQRTFLVRFRDKIIPLASEDVAFFYTSEERVSAFNFKGERYPIERTLESLQQLLPSNMYFRANRQFIISREAVKDISVWFGSRLLLNLTLDTPEKIIISKARVPEFKAWLVGSPKA
ncbi:MAG: response regulator transcription factor [Alistipes sp.]|nr:response regulator transcription factor [Alistipes sp.]